MSNYKLSKEAVALLKEIEVLSLQPYDDSKGIKSAPTKSWSPESTIGYGHLILQNEWNQYKNGITKEQAETLFLKDSEPMVTAINKLLKVPVTQQEFDALVILAFNIGLGAFIKSSVLKMVNKVGGSNYPTLEEAWLAFNKDQGKVSKGLVNRRKAEYNIYTKGVYQRW